MRGSRRRKTGILEMIQNTKTKPKTPLQTHPLVFAKIFGSADFPEKRSLQFSHFSRFLVLILWPVQNLSLFLYLCLSFSVCLWFCLSVIVFLCFYVLGILLSMFFSGSHCLIVHLCLLGFFLHFLSLCVVLLYMSVCVCR